MIVNRSLFGPRRVPGGTFGPMPRGFRGIESVSNTCPTGRPVQWSIGPEGAVGLAGLLGLSGQLGVSIEQDSALTATAAGPGSEQSG